MYGFDKKIGTADDLARMKFGVNANRNTHIRKHIEKYCEELKISSTEMLEKALREPMGEPVKAIINQNRLIAYCDMCGGAEAINPGGSFYCLTCYNVDNNGVPRPITFPRQLQNIIELLERRRKFTERNYLGESIAELKKENRLVGV